MGLANADTIVDRCQGGLLCRRCWARAPMPVGVSVDAFVRQVDAFNQVHATCVARDLWPYAYSTDGERYVQVPGYTADDAAARALQEHPGLDRLWVARCVHKYPAGFVNAYRILDLVREEAADWGGEPGAAWLNGLEDNAEVVDGLRNLVGEYLARHRPLRFFQVAEAREVSRAAIG